MTDARVLTFAASLANSSTRADAAIALARKLGAEDVIIFVLDAEVGVLLPALGFQQTLPQGRRWRALIDQCAREGRFEGEAPRLDGGATVPAVARTAADGSVLVALGGAPNALAVEHACLWVPVVAAAFRVERTARRVARDVASARDVAQRASSVAGGLDAARRELQRVLADAERARDRFAFLAEAGALLSSSLDCAGNLAEFARLVTPRLADGCVVDVACDADPGIDRIASAFAGTDEQVDLRRAYVADPRRRQAIADVMKSRHAALLDDGDSMMLFIVPLIARAHPLGAISFLTTAARVEDGEDRSLMEELGRRAALAMDNARLYHDAQETNRTKDEFLATLSHEIRTPLNAVLGWAQMLRRGGLPEGARIRALQTIERNAQAQARLIEDLLDLSRIVSGKIRLDVKPINLCELIDSVAESVEPAADAKGIRIVRVLDPTVAPHEGDPTRLQQVIWNLVTNAVKFGSDGGEVELCLSQSGAHVELKVIDDGEGIRAEFLPFVFDRFRQADSKSTRSHGGLGLGLAIVRHLVELHGGTVRAESAGLGRGATFTVRLPARQKPETVHSKTPLPVPLASLNGVSVLVVDDEADARELMLTLLGQCGARAIAVSSAREAFDTVQSMAPSILVSDVGMPVEDGYTLIRRVRELPPHRGGLVPAVAVTAFASADDRRRLLEAGFHAHIAKPVEPTELVLLIARLAHDFSAVEDRVGGTS